MPYTDADVYSISALQSRAATLKSEAIILPRTKFSRVEGSSTISTIIPPIDNYHELVFVFNNDCLIDTSGNVATAVVGIPESVVSLFYDPRLRKYNVLTSSSGSGSSGDLDALRHADYLTFTNESALLTDSKNLLAGIRVTFDDSILHERTINVDVGDIDSSIGLILGADILTWNNESALYSNSRQLIAGSNITFNDTVPGQRIINSSSGSSLPTDAIGKVLISQGVGVTSIFSPDPKVTSISLGTNPATTGAVRLANNDAIYARDAANTANLRMFIVDNANDVVFGSITNPGTTQFHSAGYMYFYVGSTSMIWAGTNLVPGTDGVTGLGHPSFRWSVAYISGDVNSSSLIASGYIAIGTNPALTGAVRLANNQSIVARSVGNNLDLPLIGTNTGNDTVIGNSSTQIVLNNALAVGANYIEFTERSPVPVPNSDHASLFLRDTSGRTNLAIQYSSGIAQEIATLPLSAAGDVTGPGISVDNDIAVYNGTTGKIIKDSGKLVSNIAFINQVNTFTQVQEYNQQVTFRGTSPTFNFVETDAPIDSKNWQLNVDSQVFRLYVSNDAWSPLTIPITAYRDGNVFIGNILTAVGLGSTPLNATNLTSGTVPDAILSSNVPLKNTGNTWTNWQSIDSSSPILVFNETDQAANQRRWSLHVASGTFYLQAQDDATNPVSSPFIINRNGSVAIGQDIFEKGRSTAIGHWIVVPFNAANFTGISAMTWTVASGDILHNRYTLVGKTLIWSIYINGGTIGGTLSTHLVLTLPVGTLVVNSGNKPARCENAGVSIDTDTSYFGGNLAIRKINASNFVAGQLILSFTVALEIA